jgi:UDP-2,4-diacetamido-2,4,6-trideoxy-beta-L-altropyranose hydrolase
MNVVFRADASISIGTGHIMRCLTLADTLTKRGAECHFICRQHIGDALDFIRQRGHSAYGLPIDDSSVASVDFSADAAQTRSIMTGLHPDWLIVDHYHLGYEWECQIRSAVKRVLVIDDIGRPHRCDMLLDQNFHNPVHARYRESLTADTELLLGSEFALVRAEFATLRPPALKRRDGSLSRLLVSMGGTDPGNETRKVLAGLLMSWQSKWAIDVVIGACNPHMNSVEESCQRLPNATLHVQADNMAQLMLTADCAINAGGSTTWERCCLGLPALVTVVSNDQAAVAESVAKVGAHMLMGRDTQLSAESYAQAIGMLTAGRLCEMSAAAARICDGLGAERVAARLH